MIGSLSSYRRRPRIGWSSWLLFVCALGVWPVALDGAEITDAEVADGFVELFDNESLLGWQTAGADAWSVEQGRLTASQGAAWIHTGGAFDDFTLRFEVRLADSNARANLWFRAAGDRDSPGPDRGHSVSFTGRADHPALLRAGGEPRVLPAQALRPAGRWNAVEIRCRGRKLDLVLNGKNVAAVEGTGPEEGGIGLEVTKGTAAFRHLRIREEGDQPLFTGKDLSGWQIVGGGEAIWSVDDEGNLVCSGEPGGWISTVDTFDDFTLRLEYQLEAGGNSGVYIRAPHEGHISRLGMEIQVLDDGAERYANLKPYQFTGSIYAVVPPSRHVTRPAGQWNRLQIQCSGRQVSSWVNGRLVTSANLDDYEELASRPGKGYIGFQNHRSRILYRNVRLRTHAGRPEDRAQAKGR